MPLRLMEFPILVAVFGALFGMRRNTTTDCDAFKKQDLLAIIAPAAFSRAICLKTFQFSNFSISSIQKTPMDIDPNEFSPQADK
jgi:hypothetical protein